VRAGFEVYRREDLPAGFTAEGPAIVEEYGSTTVIEAGFTVEVDKLANLLLHRARRGEACLARVGDRPS
jgi:N-methylhydantoinase A